ncbi:hypothetical protein ABZ633_39550, partial [Streptomyces xanthochromogenes]
SDPHPADTSYLRDTATITNRQPLRQDDFKVSSGRVRLPHHPHRARRDRPAGREVGAGEKTSQRFGRIYVLVNNAGYANVSAVETLKNSC